MSKCTAAQAIAEAQYWIGYCEKASEDYAKSDNKAYFASNAGSKNYTYFGNLWGYQGQAWCALFVTTVIYRACGKSQTDAKSVLHGLLPYTRCDQLYDTCSNTAYKGRSKYYGGSWTPKPGDVIIFTQNNQRVHTGFVESATSTTVNTIEGNVGDKVNRKSYSISSSYIWGYVRPLYTSAVTGTTVTGTTDTVGSSVTVSVNELKNGCTGDQVKTIQRILYAYGYGTTVDGDFGDKTEKAVKELQSKLKVTSDGVVGKNTWTAILTKLD